MEKLLIGLLILGSTMSHAVTRVCIITQGSHVWLECAHKNKGKAVRLDMEITTAIRERLDYGYTLVNTTNASAGNYPSTLYLFTKKLKDEQ